MVKPCIKCGASERYKSGDCAPCQRARSLKRTRERPEENRARAAKWFAENPERAHANSARWRADNPDRNRELQARWRAENSLHLCMYKTLDYAAKTLAKNEALWQELYG